MVFKDDLQCTTAELQVVYGITLHLPGEFFTNTSNSCDDLASYVTRLKASSYWPSPVCTQLQNNIHVGN